LFTIPLLSILTWWGCLPADQPHTIVAVTFTQWQRWIWSEE
jgi:hypothetical protein